MGVGSITSMNSMSGIWKTAARSTDVKSKTIQKEIAGAQQQMQKVSSKEGLSANEKATERKKQQREIADLNTELKRHQDEFLRSRKRELMMELQKENGVSDEEPLATGLRTEEADKKDLAEKETKITAADMAEKAAYNKEALPANAAMELPAKQEGYQGTVIFQNSDGVVLLKEEQKQDKTEKAESKEQETDNEKEADTGMSHKEIYDIISDDAAAQQTSARETQIAKIKGSIAVLKGEISQDERHGINTDQKQAELEKLEKKEAQARMLSSTGSEEKEQTKNPVAKLKVSGIQKKEVDDTFFNASKLSGEEAWAAQQIFSVSFGN